MGYLLIELSLGGLGTFVVDFGVREAYFGWGISIYCMLLGLLLTVAVSLVTSPAAEEDRSVYRVQSAD